MGKRKKRCNGRKDRRLKKRERTSGGNTERGSTVEIEDSKLVNGKLSIRYLCRERKKKLKNITSIASNYGK